MLPNETPTSVTATQKKKAFANQSGSWFTNQKSCASPNTPMMNMNKPPDINSTARTTRTRGFVPYRYWRTGDIETSSDDSIQMQLCRGQHITTQDSEKGSCRFNSKIRRCRVCAGRG